MKDKDRGQVLRCSTNCSLCSRIERLEGVAASGEITGLGRQLQLRRGQVSSKDWAAGAPIIFIVSHHILFFSSHVTAYIRTSLTRHLSPPVTSDDEYDQFSCKYSHQIMTTATRAQNLLFIILKHTVLLSDVERKQGTRTLVSICQLGRQMLQMGQRRSLADSPNGTDVKMGGEEGRGDKSLSSTIPLFSTHGHFH